MQTSIHDFREFKTAVEANDVVCLFGTGISAALTGKKYSWYKWIVDGIHYMKDKEFAKALELSLNQDSSAENMIRVVGEVLSATKEDNSYHIWMKKSFESDHITNSDLARTLKKLLMSQCVFATTNYDRYLEKATGLDSLSYEQPEAAFSMLNNKEHHSVLHIHGIYDSEQGVDNIVADQAQYNTVLDDKGAQFIQNILGTRMLIFIGCGQTGDDVNISQFMRFAKTYLKMDQTYYFLCKQGQDIEGLPENVIAIPYGDDYADFPAFLEDLAQVRMTALMQQHPLIGLTPYHKHNRLSASLAKYHYTQENIPFCGRSRELQQLMDFLQPHIKSASWWAVTGQAGAGKSRLAMEWLHQLPAYWFGFFLSDVFTDLSIQSFIPFSDTAIVIDYVVGRESIIADAMRKLKDRFQSTGYSLRILLLERESSKESGAWFSRLMKAWGRFASMQENIYSDDFLCLDDMELHAVDEFIGQVCKQKQLPEDAERDRYLRSVYAEKFEVLRFRPLYVQIFVEAWIDHGCTLPRYDSFEDLLAEMLSREQSRWLDVFGQDQGCCNAIIRLIIRACIAGELKISDIPDYYQEDWKVVKRYIETHTFPGMQRDKEMNSILADVCQNIHSENAVLRPMFPDLLKEYMFFYYHEKERLADVMRELWEHSAHACSVFLRRCMTDFPNNAFYLMVLNTFAASEDDMTILLGRQEMLKKKIIHKNDDPIVLLRIIANEQAFWKALQIPPSTDEKAEEMAILKISGLKLVVDQLGGWSLYDLTPMMEAVDDMLAVPCLEAGTIIKQMFLDEIIRELAEKGFATEASEVIEKQEKLNGHGDEELSRLFHLNNCNVEMMNCLMACQFKKADEILTQINSACNRSNIEEVRVAAHACQNFTHIAAMAEKSKFIEKGLAIMQEMHEQYPSDFLITSRYFVCFVSKLQYQFFSANCLSMKELESKLREIEAELESMGFRGDEDSDEAFSSAWGITHTLHINLIKNDGANLLNLIFKCDRLLENNIHAIEVATTKLHAICALHKNVLRNKISKEEIKDAFRYVEQNPDSESLRETFFQALEQSEEATNRNSYMTKWVVHGAIQDAWYNPISDGGVPEIEDMLWSMSEADDREPYRRNHPKVGANEPCPCGSGKKFKKCCRGNGQFD